MKKVGVTIRTEAPVLLGDGPASHYLVESLDFIPGNTLRGILAWHYLSKGGKPEDQDFRRLFLTGESRFGFARIEGTEVIPLSARTCKYEGGFLADAGHGAWDSVLSGSKEMRCNAPCCGGPLDYLEGYYDPSRGASREVKKRLIGRTAIDPKRGSASFGKLYRQRVIEEGQSFRAVIEVPNELEGALFKLLDDSPFAAIGTAKSRGQGWVRLERQSTGEPDWKSAQERFDEFHKLLGKENPCILAVTLQSDAIFSDEYLRDRTAPALADLEPFGIDIDEWRCRVRKGEARKRADEPFESFATTRLVFGFDGEPVKLPRIPRLAVTAGSVFLFKASDEGTKPKIPSGKGVAWIGEKNGEGYGRAILWHPFHSKFAFGEQKQIAESDQEVEVAGNG